MNFYAVDVVILLVIGVMGYFMRRYGYPVAPSWWRILGPMAEEQLRRALAISQGVILDLLICPFAERSRTASWPC